MRTPIDTPLIAVVIPALNEAEGIAQTIQRTRLALPNAKVFVIGGLSTDGTDAIALANGATIISCLQPGKSAAIKKAFRVINASVLCMLDADGTYPPEDLRHMIQTLYHYRCGAVSGIRKTSGLKTINYFGNIFLTWLANILYSKTNNSGDLTSGMWTFTHDTYKAIVIDSEGFCLEANIFTELDRLNILLGGLYIPYGRRLGKSKLNKLDGIKIAWYLIRKRLAARGSQLANETHGYHTEHD